MMTWYKGGTPRTRIDHLWIRGAAITLRRTQLAINARSVSDHCLVVGSVPLEGKERPTLKP